MTMWHDFKQEKPEKSADYLVLTELDENAEGKIYAGVEVMEYFAKGEMIPLHGLHHYPEHRDAEQRILDSIFNPVCVESIGAFYEQDARDDYYPVKNVLAWAELPAIPMTFAGDQNAYLEWAKEI